MATESPAMAVIWSAESSNVATTESTKVKPVTTATAMSAMVAMTNVAAKSAATTASMLAKPATMATALKPTPAPVAA
jgi:hypothetical protein